MRPPFLVWSCILVGSIGCLAPRPALATLAPGPFASGQPWADAAATDGTSFFIDGLSYPVPGTLRPTGPFTFRLSAPGPSRFLYATRGDPSCGSAADARAFYYTVVPDDPSIGHLAPIATLCIPHGIAFDGYVLGQQQIAWVVELSQPSASTELMHWIDLGSGATAASSLTQDIDDNAGFPQFSPSITVAFTREIPQLSTTATYHLIDLCPGTLGTIDNPGGGPLAGLPAPEPTAEIVDTGGGHFVARVSHPSFPGGSIDVTVPDCLGSVTTTTVSTVSTTSLVVTTPSRASPRPRAAARPCRRS
jgi:hypothetical protein